MAATRLQSPTVVGFFTSPVVICAALPSFNNRLGQAKVNPIKDYPSRALPSLMTHGSSFDFPLLLGLIWAWWSCVGMAMA